GLPSLGSLCAVRSGGRGGDRREARTAEGLRESSLPARRRTVHSCSARPGVLLIELQEQRLVPPAQGIEGGGVSNGKMKDGLVKRGSTWAYVVSEVDATTGRKKPTWHGGYATQEDARVARDDARA